MLAVTETVKERLMDRYARSAAIWDAYHMSGIPSIGWCRIDMVGGPGLRDCLGDELYDFVATALQRLHGVDGELIRKKYLVKILKALASMDARAIEEVCIQALHLPWSPSYIAKRLEAASKASVASAA